MPEPIARVVSRAPVATPDCGTPRGYRLHGYHREVPCDRCCAAHALTEAARRITHRTAPDQPLQYRAALNGREPAEALTTRDRARLVAALTVRGWTVQRIAEHTRMTTYTTARIRDRLVAAGVTTPPTNLGESA